MRAHRFITPFLLLSILAACDAPPPAVEAPVAEAAHSDGIAWFDGEVDDAFALAREENKPLFLYWGAVWCPPCHYLKTKIFTREEFVAQTRAFVSVYLDGDTERAQILGERFGAMGYPTVILFNPAGQEMTRVPSTLPVERYTEVLERAMSRMRPIKEILGDVLATGPANADAIDLNLLAFYAWSQDHEVKLADEEKLATFRTFYRETPEALADERSRFLTLYLSEAIRRSREKDGAADPVLSSDELVALRSAVPALLSDSRLLGLNLDLLLYWSRETVELLHPEATPERADLITAWKAAATAVEADASLTVDDRLSALLPRIWLTELELVAETGAAESGDGGEVALPEELRQQIRERIAWAGETVTDEGELQAVMSTMAALLEEASLSSEAEALLSDRLADTAAPYYYMSWIAGMKREAGQPDEALEWYRKAYDSATGRYTRFRWGSIYLRQLMKLAPADAVTLEAEAIPILDELLTLEDAFAGGNHSRLGQLDSALHKWNESGEHEALLARLRDRVHAACDRYPQDGDDAQRDRCEAFLHPEAETGS